ncbi:MAG TPA: alpha/beta hydrolase [Vulgatibacter sp.]|nr:alpha/beta hydrolase [Vulgatibacter sp.]
MIPLRESRVRANGLLHHVLTWEPKGPRPAATVLCAHGFLDVGFSFRQVAERLASWGHRVVAFDWRGHGETEWIGAGGYYHFMDYVADLADLVDALAPGPLHLVGHSMGGTAAALFAGTFPTRVDRLVLLEGLGPEEAPPSPPPERTARWVRAVRKARERPHRRMVNLEEALGRMRVQNPALPDDLGLELAARSTRKVDGGYEWSFDPVHRTRGPYPFRAETFLPYLRAIRAPTLLVDGEHGYRAADHADRVTALPHAERLELSGVGHMMHWFAADAVAEAIHAFLSRPAG